MQTSTDLITDGERLVFEVIADYLKNNRTFRLTKILPYLSSRLAMSSMNLNSDGIKKNVISLMKKKFIVEGSKLTKETALDCEKRFEIYSFIKRNPGLHFRAIKESTKENQYVAYSHLEVLVKFGFIKSETVRNNVIYFDSSLDLEDVLPIHLASKKKSKKIIAYLKENDIGVTKTQISKNLGMHLKTLDDYLNALEKYGFIIKEKLSGKTLYFASE